MKKLIMLLPIILLLGCQKEWEQPTFEVVFGIEKPITEVSENVFTTLISPYSLRSEKRQIVIEALNCNSLRTVVYPGTWELSIYSDGKLIAYGKFDIQIPGLYIIKN